MLLIGLTGGVVLGSAAGARRTASAYARYLLATDAADVGAHAADVARVASDLVRLDLCGVDNQCAVTTASRPVDVLDYTRVRSIPMILAAVLAILGLLVLGHLLMTSLAAADGTTASCARSASPRQIWVAVAAQAGERRRGRAARAQPAPLLRWD